jgi:hypothetical protein
MQQRRADHVENVAFVRGLSEIGLVLSVAICVGPVLGERLRRISLSWSTGVAFRLRVSSFGL